MIPATWIASMGGVIGPSTVKLIGKLWPFAVILGLVIALLLTRNTLSETKRQRDAEKAAHAETIANYKLAQEAATALAERQRRDLEEQSRQNASRAEDRHAQELADINARTDAYIRANRVRPEGAVCPASGTPTPGEDQRASVSTPVSPDALVSVTADDLHACSGAVAYAIAAFEWARTLNHPVDPPAP